MARATISGGHGFTYEARVFHFCFISAYIKEKKDFCLEREVKEAGKFDDVVFHENGNNYLFIQLKQIQSSEKNITHAQLFCEKYNGNYNLLKYIKSFLDINSNEKFKNKIKCAVVFTNIDMDLKDGKLDLAKNPTKNAKEWYNGLKELKPTEVCLDEDVIINFSSKVGNPKYYKFADDKNFIQVLMNQAEFFKTQIRDKKSRQIGEEFLPFLNSLTEENIKFALEQIIYAVNQPNDEDLEEIIKEQIKDKFAITNANDIYNELDNKFRSWCDGKTGNFPEKITYKDAQNFFQNNLKVIKFGVSAPTDFFTGRHEELLQIREELLKTGNLIVSQTVTINGLGGVGKTETTRQFIKEYGDSDFYGRIIWISAENDKSVEKSFKRLADTLAIGQKEYIKTIIDHTFEYFNGFKVLFVFDNYDKKGEENSKSLVAYCRECASKQRGQNRPYFLFTSRDKNCLPGVSSIDLGMLAQNEAVELIKNHLKGEHNIEDIKELAKILHYFPLAIRQAIAYINEKFENVLGKRYELKNYLEDFETKRKEVLGKEFEDDFGTQKQTTMITWNITLETIEKYDEGAICIEILKSLSYLYADEIDVNIFLSNFTEEQINKAVALLERYCLISKRNDSKIQIHRLVQVVIQEKFIARKNKIVEKTVRIIFPNHFYFQNRLFCVSALFPASQSKLYNLFLNRKNFEKPFDFEQVLHFNNIFSHLNNSFENYILYKELYDDVNSKHLLRIILRDNLPNIKKIDDTSLKFMVENHFEEIIEKNCVNFVQIVIEKGLTKNLDFSKTIKFYPTMISEMFLLVFSKTKITRWFEHNKYKENFQIAAEISRNFVQKTPNINILTKDGCTILHLVCMQSIPNLPFIECLVENGIDINKQDEYERTAIYYAIWRGHKEIAKYLLSLSKEKCEENLRCAIEKDYPSLVKIFFDKHFERDHKFKNARYGATPIEVAIRFLSVETVFLMKSEFVEFAKQGGDVHLSFPAETLLINCIKRKYFFDKRELLLEHVKLFVENGVNVHAKDWLGNCAVSYAKKYRYDNIVTFLENYLLEIVLRDNSEDIEKFDVTSLLLMVENYFAKIIEKNSINFIKFVIEIDLIENFDTSQTFKLFPTMSIEMFLLVFPKTKVSPYLWKTRLKSKVPIPPEISENFVKKTSNINISSLDGLTVLHVACLYWTPDLQFIISLVENGIDINKEDVYQRTALYYAADQGHIEITQYLAI